MVIFGNFDRIRTFRKFDQNFFGKFDQSGNFLKFD